MTLLPKKSLTGISAGWLLLVAGGAATGAEPPAITCAQEKAAGAAYSEICRAYLEGFLDGALLTDTAIADHAREDKGFFDRYAERAYQTRVNTTRVTPPPATELADFCLPDDVPRSTIVDQLANELAAADPGSENLSQAAYELIKARLPCPG